MQRIREELHDGKRIRVVDLTGIAADAYPAVFQEAARVIAASPPQSVLLATVVKGARFGAGAGEHVKAYSRAIRPYLKAGAVVGLSPLHQVIFLSVRPFLHSTVTAFADLPAAKAWLVKKADER